MIASIFAQELPLVYNIENTGADCPRPLLQSIDQLPIIQSLPDPFEWADGRGRMSNYSDWRLRRAEIGAQILHYEIGDKPARPDTITASYSAGKLTVNVTKNGKTITLTSSISLPSGTGPFPAIIRMTFGTYNPPAANTGNIADIAYYHDQVTTYNSPQNSDPYYGLYPNLNIDNTGQYSAWAWGVSRIIDGLELVKDVLPIDIKHLAVMGCSYAGKMALFSGAFDERVALTIALESGGGGATSWRYSGSEPTGSVEGLAQTSNQWFKESMFQFGGSNVSKLPEDHHELMAMVAPRALFVTGNPDYTWLSNPSCYVASKACQQVYDALGISDRFGFSIVGGHAHCSIPADQNLELSAFEDKFLLGKENVNTNVSTSPYSIDLSKWITWTNPTLSDDTTYYTTLTYPSDLQAGLDTSITLRWNKVKKVEKYYIQLSTDQSFANIDKSDSTIADTSKTFSGLLKSKKYYWRVKVKSTSGLGPWSNILSFITTLSIPAKPQIISANSNKTGYVTLKWNKIENSDRYSIQVAYDQAFVNIFKSTTSTDTVKEISWFSENKKYYWRVLASNIAGSGSWSDVRDFTILYTPTNLGLQLNTSNEITLTWNDNSTIKDGYLIERKQSPDTSFSVLDTIMGSAHQYVDKTVEEAQTYTYRVKAYKDSLESNYSNEVSITIVGVEEEGIPTKYSVSQNYPNPFNPTTKIKFALPKAAMTKIIIYDLLGRIVQTVLNKELEPGYHEIIFDASHTEQGRSMTSGIYFYKIQSGNFIQTKKMILLK